MKKEIVEIPKNCPSCNSELELVKDQLFCRNPSCGDKQIKVVESYAKKMKIKGLGIKTIEKLGLISINDIYELTLEQVTDAIGEKLGQKLINEIEKSKNTTLDVFLSACSIYLIGQTIAKKLLPFINSPKELNMEVCVKAGLGEKARNSLMDWVDHQFVGNLEYLPVNFQKVEVEEVTDDYYKATVCVTGRTPNHTKNSLAKELFKKKVKVVNSVSKSIDYLICHDRKNSSKERTAEHLGVPIITLEELYKFINKEKIENE